jgi:hypothetical protein
MPTLSITRIFRCRLLALLWLFGLPALAFGAQGDLASLEQEKERLALQASIEKSRADIADSIRKQRENQALSDLTIRQKQAEARRAEAEARIPPTQAKALSGAIDIKQFGAAGRVVAVDLAQDLAKELCERIQAAPGVGKVAIFDAQTASGVVAARTLEKQMQLLSAGLQGALSAPAERAAKAFAAPGFDAAIATGTIKAFADLASLFKTDVSVTNTSFPDSKAFFVTAMASTCGERLASLGTGYLGELDSTGMDELVDKTLAILKDREALQARIDEVKAKFAKEKDAARKSALQSRLGNLNAVAKQVDDFLDGIKPGQASDKSTLVIASRYLAESKRVSHAKVLDLSISLEGLSIVRNNFFTGQKLRLSATGIVSYRIQELDGALVTAGVMRRMAKPVSVNLRGNALNDRFWNDGG